MPQGLTSLAANPSTSIMSCLVPILIRKKKKLTSKRAVVTNYRSVSNCCRKNEKKNYDVLIVTVGEWLGSMRALKTSTMI